MKYPNAAKDAIASTESRGRIWQAVGVGDRNVCCGNGVVLSVFSMKILIGLFFALTSLSAWSWGSEGHKVVALIAEAQLITEARAEVERLLAVEPGQTMASISTWADEHRNPATGPWHYVNFPRGACNYVAERECPEGKCVVAMIEKEIQVIASQDTDEKRLTALKYLVHFVADVHQPLHAGYADDRGGNQYQLQAFMRGSNLHALWDTGLIKNLNEAPDAMASRLARVSTTYSKINLDPANAAEESCKIVGIEGFYPERRVGQDYIDRFTPVLEQRLKIAGDRLAGILNRTLK